MENEKKAVNCLSDYCTYAIISKVADDRGNSNTIVEDMFTIKSSSLKDYMYRIMNDFISPFYFNNRNMFLVKICSLDGQSAMVQHVNTVPEILCPITDYISPNMRRYQQTIQILNYTPLGYYKKSEDERKEIQERLDNAIVEYVSKYVAPDISEKVSSDQMKSIKDILNNTNSVNSDVKR